MGRFIAAGIILAIYGSGLYYVGVKLFRWLRLFAPAMHTKIFCGICVVFILSIVLAFLPFDIGIKKILVWFAWFLMGLFVYFLLFFLLSDIVLIIAPKHLYILFGWIVIGLVALTAAYGLYNGKQIKQVSYKINLEKDTKLERFNIVLAADLHLWYVNDEKWLSKVVEKINELEPDIVCFAGDIFNDNFKAIRYPEQAVRSLQNIKTKHGVFACMGNHDGGKTYNDMVSFLEQGNVKVLQDEYLVIDDKFIIVGRADASPIGGGAPARKELPAVLGGIDAAKPIIVMDHNPAHIGEYGKEIDIILAGHTHKGQLFPASLITNLIFDADYGYYRKDVNSPHVVVTSGAGVWGPPLRVGTNNEIVQIIVN